MTPSSPDPADGREGPLPLTRGGSRRARGQPQLGQYGEPVEVAVDLVQLVATDFEEFAAGQSQ